MRLPHVYRLFDYWRDNPPVHLMVAGYLGLNKHPRHANVGQPAAGTMSADALIAALGPMVRVVKKGKPDDKGTPNG